MTSRRYRALLIGEDRMLQSTLRNYLREKGFRVRTAQSAEKVKEEVNRFPPNLALSEISEGGASEDGLLQVVSKQRRKDCFLILLADDSQIEGAIDLLKAGAADYLTKPVDLAALDAVLAKITKELDERRHLRERQGRLERRSGFGPFVGTSPGMREVYRLIKLLAPKNTPVFILGESGTGKELVARTLHELGKHPGKPFITVNAAALPKDLIESQLFGHEKGAFTGATKRQLGCFEMAHEGTLLLDEISELSSDLQPKLLRVLENQKVRRIGAEQEVEFDVRVLAATNVDLNKALREKSMRRDLYYRLAVFTIEVPPLRNRPGDIELLALHFVRRFNEKHGLMIEGISDEALETLQAYQWPGNVRELSNVIERAAVLAKDDCIRSAQPPAHLDGQLLGAEDHIVLPVGISLSEAEKRILHKTLHSTDFNKSATARILGVDVKTVRHKVKAYKIVEPG